MEGNGNDPMDVVRRLAETYRGVKLGPGVVGKTGYATAALFVVWIFVICRLSDKPDAAWFNAALFVGGLIATGVYIWWVRGIQDFAAKNPGLAVLEGAQFIEYQKWEAGIKGLPAPKGPLIKNPNAPKTLEHDGGAK